jgi:hypothetical protein
MPGSSRLAWRSSPVFVPFGAVHTKSRKGADSARPPSPHQLSVPSESLRLKTTNLDAVSGCSSSCHSPRSGPKSRPNAAHLGLIPDCPPQAYNHLPGFKVTPWCSWPGPSGVLLHGRLGALTPVRCDWGSLEGCNGREWPSAGRTAWLPQPHDPGGAADWSPPSLPAENRAIKPHPSVLPPPWPADHPACADDCIPSRTAGSAFGHHRPLLSSEQSRCVESSGACSCRSFEPHRAWLHAVRPICRFLVPLRRVAVVPGIFADPNMVHRSPQFSESSITNSLPHLPTQATPLGEHHRYSFPSVANDT